MGVFGPPLIPFLGLIQSRVRRPGPDSELAQPDSESEVRVSGSAGVPSQLVRVTDTSQPAAEVDPVLVRAMPFSRECFSHFLAVRCNSLPQGG